MPFYNFKETDIFYNQIESTPKQEFFVFDSSVYYNNRSVQSGSFTGSVVSRRGTLSLFEANIDRSATQTGLIKPFVFATSDYIAFRNITTRVYFAQYGPSDKITGSYPLTSSATREYFAENSSRPRVTALKNTLNYYNPKSSHYSFSSSLGNKSAQAINLLSIPNVFYGGRLRKGTVNLKYYITGTLVGELKDEHLNGELKQVGPVGSTGSGSVAGVVLYDEGVVLLTGSWDLTTVTYTYPDSDPDKAKWLYFATGMNDGNAAGTENSSSYNLEFEATNLVPNITMFCHAPRGELDYSNNPSFVSSSQVVSTVANSGTLQYIQPTLKITNTVSASYTSPTASYESQTFISKIGIYDEKNNLIAIANLSKPVRKTLDRDFTFKIKMDV